MFSYLQGFLADKTPMHAVIDVGGVGYEVMIPLSTYGRLPEPGQKVRMLTHVHIRENDHQIFGFMTEDEKALFRLLLTVSDVGPKKALAVLSGLEVSELKRSIINENLAALTSISGVGRKIAEKIIIELREKIVVDDKLNAKRPADKDPAGESLVQDTVLVLVSLGYKKQDAQDAIKKIFSSAEPKKPHSVEELVRASLKVI